MAWQWSSEVKRYRDQASGRFLSASANVTLRDHYLEMQRQTMASLAQRVSAGELTIGQWETQMRAAVKASNVTAFSYGRGGRQAVTADDRTVLGQLIDKQNAYLSGFVRDLVAGEMSAAQIEARATLYASAAVHANAAGEDAAWVGSDYQELNVRGGSRFPCDECPALSAQGWVDGGILPRPGTRSCAANCRCSLARRLKAQPAVESQRLRVVA